MDPETIIKDALGGKYEILSVVGKGGMATVYKAIQKSLDRTVAIKVVHQNLVHDEEFIKRFIREAKVCASLNHTNVITIYDVGSIGTVHYMAMEYLEGETLRDRIKNRGKISAENTIRFIQPVADALDYIHKRNIIHRDVKSSNIFITREGRSVLMDFGIVFSEEGEPLSQDGSILGTPEYMSPEQAEGKLKLDGRTDIYSLGVIMYECLTGTLPYRSENYITTLLRVIQEEAPPVSSINSKIPAWLSSVIAGCMVKDRNKRIQSGNALVEALQNKEKIRVAGSQRDYATKKISRRDIPSASTVRKESSAPKAKSRNNGLLVLSILLAFIIVVILVMMNFGSNQRRNQHRAQGGAAALQQQVLSVDSLEKDNTDSIINQYLKTGDIHLSNKEFDQAIDAFGKALELAPERASIDSMISNAKSEKARYTEKLRAAEEERKLALEQARIAKERREEQKRIERERQQRIQKEKEAARRKATATDYDGNTYKTIRIGTQIWMAENLRTTHYADGTIIPYTTSNTAWSNLSINEKAYCWYDNSTVNRDIYGGLYTWAAAMNGNSSSDSNPSNVQGVCPEGWHLPSDAEWKELEKHLGMSITRVNEVGWRGTQEGGKLKETGASHWSGTNSGSTNESGFLALPGGDRNFGGSFYGIGNSAYFWTTTEQGSSNAWYRNLYYGRMEVHRDSYGKMHGFSVRCVMD